MKILFTTTGNDLNAVLDPRFGRAAKFLIYDLDNDKYEIFDNSVNIAAAHGAGIAAAESVCNLGVEAVITGNCGPNAFAALTAAGIKIYTVASASIASLLEAYKNGKLNLSQTANVAGHWNEGGDVVNSKNIRTENFDNNINNVPVNTSNPYCTGQRQGRAWGGVGQGFGRGMGACGGGGARRFAARRHAGGPGAGLSGGRGMGRGGGRGLGRCVNSGAGMGFGRGMNQS